MLSMCHELGLWSVVFTTFIVMVGYIVLSLQMKKLAEEVKALTQYHGV